MTACKASRGIRQLQELGAIFQRRIPFFLAPLREHDGDAAVLGSLMVRRRSAAAAIPRPLSAVRTALRRARLVLVIFHQPFQRAAIEAAGFMRPIGVRKPWSRMPAAM